MLDSGNIEHVFVLMLENRSFDHLLGFSGISGTDAVSGDRRTIPTPAGSNTYNGVTYAPSTPGLNPMPLDPGHEFVDVVEQLGGPGATYPAGGPYPAITNGGYAANYAAQPRGTSAPSPADPLQCFTPDQAPVINALAANFVLCDGWYSSMPGPTWPNRLFVHAASSGGLDHSPSPLDIARYMLVGYRFQNGTIFDRLQDRKLPWRAYHGDAWPQVFALKGMTDYWLEGHLAPYEHFAGDLLSDYEAAYTFIEPSYGALTSNFTCGTSQHPLDDVARGEWLIKCTYEAIRNSPVWNTSLLIVTWDEHGGFYDHAAPPDGAAAPGDEPTWPTNNVSGFTFTQFGVRVPSVVVSPLMPANLLDGRHYDHTSVLATLEAIFELSPLTMRDRAAANLTSLATLTLPRSDAPSHLPDPGPPAKISGCSVLSGCATLPGIDASRDSLISQAEDGPLTGNQPGFVHVALMRDFAASPPAEYKERMARAASVRTRDEARRYLLEVLDRLSAAGTPPPANNAV